MENKYPAETLERPDCPTEHQPAFKHWQQHQPWKDDKATLTAFPPLGLSNLFRTSCVYFWPRFQRQKKKKFSGVNNRYGRSAGLLHKTKELLPRKSANGSLPPKNSLKTSSGFRNVKPPPPKWPKWPPGHKQKPHNLFYYTPFCCDGSICTKYRLCPHRRHLLLLLPLLLLISLLCRIGRKCPVCFLQWGNAQC